MIIEDGTKVKIVKVCPSKHSLMTQSKEQFIGKIGIVDGTPALFHNSNFLELPQGQYFYSLKDDNGDEISPFGWFEEELELLYFN